MTKQRRAKIIEIVNSCNVETQGYLKDKLIEEGFDVTQATVSRDIQKLNLVKIKDEKTGKYYYSSPMQTKSTSNTKFINILKETIISANNARNIIVVKTYSGMANAAAAAIDSVANDIIIGSIAGDDTIFVVVATDDQANEFTAYINSILGNRGE